MIHPLICKESGTRLCITGEQYKKLIKKPKAILWCRDGLYGMVPVEVVKNAIQLLHDANQARECADLKLQQSPLEFLWNETVEIPIETGSVMEKYNGKDNEKSDINKKW